jgi:hypothetical protein
MPRRVYATPRILTAFCAFPLATTIGCAASVAPVAHASRVQPLDDASVSIGPSAQGLLYLSRGRGYLSRSDSPVVGAEVDAAFRVSGEGPGEETFSPRAAVLAGWSTSPLPYRNPIGFEVLGAVGGGYYPVGDRVEGAFALGPRLGFPIRFTGAAPPWGHDYPAGIAVLVVPTLGSTLYFPIHGGPPAADFSVALALRLHFWSALLP